MAACSLQQHSDKIQPALWSVGGISKLLSRKRISGIPKSASVLTDTQQPSRLEALITCSCGRQQPFVAQRAARPEHRGVPAKIAHGCGSAALKLLQLCDPSQKQTLGRQKRHEHLSDMHSRRNRKSAFTHAAKGILQFFIPRGNYVLWLYLFR